MLQYAGSREPAVTIKDAAGRHKQEYHQPIRHDLTLYSCRPRSRAISFSFVRIFRHDTRPAAIDACFEQRLSTNRLDSCRAYASRLIAGEYPEKRRPSSRCEMAPLATSRDSMVLIVASDHLRSSTTLRDLPPEMLSATRGRQKHQIPSGLSSASLTILLVCSP